MRRAYAVYATVLSMSVAGVLFAQGRGGGGGLAGGVAGGATSAVGGVGAGELSNGAAGAAGRLNEGVRGGVGAGAGNGALIGGADAVSTMRQNAALSSSAQPLLPKGINATQAAAGFEDTNQFMTTLHAAHNMNIPFDELKSKTTGKGHTSIEKAARQLRPDLDDKTIKENLKLAEKQSDRDMVQASTPAGRDSVAEKIASNSQLSSRISALLPPGTSVTSAASGFRNEGQFISTAEVSHNLNLPFSDLKDRITAGQSLGEAIHAMKPDMSESEARASAQTASSQASDLREGKSASTRAGADAGANAKASRSGASVDVNANAQAGASAARPGR